MPPSDGASPTWLVVTEDDEPPMEALTAQWGGYLRGIGTGPELLAHVWSMARRSVPRGRSDASPKTAAQLIDKAEDAAPEHCPGCIDPSLYAASGCPGIEAFADQPIPEIREEHMREYIAKRDGGRNESPLETLRKMLVVHLGKHDARELERRIVNAHAFVEARLAEHVQPEDWKEAFLATKNALRDAEDHVERIGEAWRKAFPNRPDLTGPLIEHAIPILAAEMRGRSDAKPCVHDAVRRISGDTEVCADCGIVMVENEEGDHVPRTERRSLDAPPVALACVNFDGITLRVHPADVEVFARIIERATTAPVSRNDAKTSGSARPKVEPEIHDETGARSGGVEQPGGESSSAPIKLDEPRPSSAAVTESLSGRSSGRPGEGARTHIACDRCGATGQPLLNQQTFNFCKDREACGERRSSKATPEEKPAICEHRELLETDEDSDFPSGPRCGAPAEWLSCTPIIDQPVCEKHRCRCRKPLVRRDAALSDEAEQWINRIDARTPSGTLDLADPMDRARLRIAFDWIKRGRPEATPVVEEPELCVRCGQPWSQHTAYHKNHAFEAPPKKWAPDVVEAARRVLGLDLPSCEGKHQKCVADLEAFAALVRAGRESAPPGKKTT